MCDQEIIIEEINRRMDALYEKLPDASVIEKRGIFTVNEAYITGQYNALESLLNFIETYKK